MTKTPAWQHRHERREWILAAVLLFVVSRIFARWLPSLLWLVGSSTWMWAAVGVGYHTGWLKRDRPDAILRWLAEHPDQGPFEIAKGTGYASGTLYADLLRLENAGLVTSQWADHPGLPPGYPRRRVYRTTHQEHP